MQMNGNGTLPIYRKGLIGLTFDGGVVIVFFVESDWLVVAS